MLINTYRVRVKWMRLGSFQWFPVTSPRGNRHKRMQQVPYRHEEELVYCKGDKALRQASHRSGGVIFSENTKNLPGHFPAVSCKEPAFSGAFGLISRGPLQPLQFCDSVINDCFSLRQYEQPNRSYIFHNSWI